MTSHTLVALATFIVRVDVPDGSAITDEAMRNGAATLMTHRIEQSLEAAEDGAITLYPGGLDLEFLEDKTAVMVLQDRGFAPCTPVLDPCDHDQLASFASNCTAAENFPDLDSSCGE